MTVPSPVQEGAFVFITGRRKSELDKAVKQIGKNVIGLQGDVSNLADLDRLYDMVKEQKGRIDILFTNAGILESAPLGSITESYFDKVFNIVYSTKSPYAISRWWIYYSNFFSRRIQRNSGFECLPPSCHHGWSLVIVVIIPPLSASFTIQLVVA
jgi:NAD(P)-dependent dehydrogenase (short-subunit alcohol dehydrogenase family)